MANERIENAASSNGGVSKNPPGPVQDCRPKTPSPVVTFFIGGAGDKESYYMTGPFKNIEEALDLFDPKVRDLEQRRLYSSFYRGYNEVCGNRNINKYVLQHIPSKSTPVYIIGHSLGGWNGAHLSRILSSLGYVVEMLITLDPVGDGSLVWMGSNIHRTKPSPQARFWVNILAKPLEPDGSDSVAEFGERWIVDSGADLNYIANVNHYNAKKMFVTPLKDNKSAADLLHASIRKAIWR